MGLQSVKKYLNDNHNGVKELYTIILLICFYCFYRIQPLINTTLEFDELFTWNISLKSIFDIFVTCFQDTQQPLYFIIVKFCNFLSWGNLEFVGRWVSFFFGLLSVVVFYTYCNKTTKANYSVFLAALLLIHPLFFHLSTFARPYSLICLLVICHLVELSKIILNEKKSINLLIFISFLLLISHNLSLLYLFSVLVSLLISSKSTRKRILKSRKFSLGLVGLIISIVTVYFQLDHSLVNVSWIRVLSFGEAGRFVLDIFFKVKYQRLAIWEILFITTIFGAIVLSLIINKNIFFRVNFSIVLLFLFCMLTINYSFHPILVDRYFIFIIPSFLIALVFMLETISNFINENIAFLLVLFTVVHYSYNQGLDYTYRGHLKEGFQKISLMELAKEEKIYCIVKNSAKDIIFANYSKLILGSNRCLYEFTDSQNINKAIYLELNNKSIKATETVRSFRYLDDYEIINDLGNTLIMQYKK